MSSKGKMQNEDIKQLRELKEQLLKQALQLRDKLKNQNKNGHQSSVDFNM